MEQEQKDREKQEQEAAAAAAASAALREQLNVDRREQMQLLRDIATTTKETNILFRDYMKEQRK